jgi:hypothetical protein
MTALTRSLALAAIATLALLAGPASAQAIPLPPEVTIITADSLEAGESGYVSATIFNSGDVALQGEMTITQTVSPGAELGPVGSLDFEESGEIAGKSWTGAKVCEQTPRRIVCVVPLPSEGFPPGGAINFSWYTHLNVEPSASGEIVYEVEVSGGGVPSGRDRRTIAIGPQLPYTIAKWEGALRNPDRSVANQAATTPDSLLTDLWPRNHSDLFFGLLPIVAAPENLKDIVAHMPPGLVGNPSVMPKCTAIAMMADGCQADAQVGVYKGTIGGLPAFVPIFNVEPPPGYAAKFAFNYRGVTVSLLARLRPGDYGVDVISANTATTLVLNSATVEFWGVPTDSSHDAVRGACLAHGARLGNSGNLCPTGAPRDAFLRSPTRCGAPLPFGVDLNTYQHPEVFHSASFDLAPMQVCDKVPFEPSLSAETTARDVESPTGLHVTVSMPNSGLENPDAVSESDVKSVEVALPQGVTLNPSQADGLGVCTEAQYQSSELSFNPDGSKGCPSDSRIGSVSVKTPLLEETIPGDVFVAEPYANPFDSLLAIYVVLEEPMRGVLVKLAGKVEPDERTGRIVTTFSDLPQTPFSSFEFRFREGARAPLVSPPACGSYETEAQFTPWANPDQPIVTKSSFQITRGIGGAPCPPGGVPEFKPGFSAGSVNNNAGSFSEFLMRLTRLDGEQNMTKFSSVLPPGVVAKIAGVSKCSQAAIDAAEGKSGLEERANPSCPANSQIGRTIVGAGVGSVLTRVPGQLYLAGPYKGAPLSVAAITPAVAGPFDVGTVVVQEALTLDPVTAEVHVDGERSEPIPHILKGIPLKLRDLRVYVDRDKFTLNPTSCDPSSVKATLFGSYLDVFSSADDVAVSLESRYQAANCANLGFKPKMALKLKGGTRRGAHPALRAVFRPRPGDANLAKAVVKLPRSAFLDQAHIRTICTRVQWAADNCPKGAIYGKVRAFTPLLDEPLVGFAYLRSSNNKLPDLVFDLDGVVDIEASARIDSVKGAIRATFPFVPDAPLTKVVVEMRGAKKGLIVNSRDLCAAKSRAEVKLDAHNGKAEDSRPVVGVRCGKKHRRGGRGK